MDSPRASRRANELKFPGHVPDRGHHRRPCDWAALQVSGFIPSISRELTAVDTSIGSLIGEQVGESSFVALAIALAVETLDRFKVPPIVSTIVVALGTGLVAGADQQAVLPALPLIAAMSLSAALVVPLYRRRGFLAAWVAAIVNGLVVDALAARSLEEPAIVQVSSYLFTLVVVLAIAGAWGVVKPMLRRTPAPVRAA